MKNDARVLEPERERERDISNQTIT